MNSVDGFGSGGGKPGKNSGFSTKGSNFNKGSGFNFNKKPRKKIGVSKAFERSFTFFVLFLFILVMAFCGGFCGGWFSCHFNRNESFKSKPYFAKGDGALINASQNDSDVEAVVEKVTPAIVGVCSPTFDYEKTIKNRSKSDFPFFKYFFGDDLISNNSYIIGNSKLKRNDVGAIGSGFFIKDEKGNPYIITNYHVIKSYVENVLLGAVRPDPKFDKVLIILKNNVSDSKKAEIVGYDKDCDIAVLRIPDLDPSSVSSLQFAAPGTTKIGSMALVAGNPFTLEHYTITSGIVGALRKIEFDGVSRKIDIVQIDAAINLGNSGGPVVNRRGEVIGVATAKFVNKGRGENQIDGFGIAIDSKVVANVFDAVVNKGLKKGSEYPSLGIVPFDRDTAYFGVEGVVIESFTNDSVAQAAGMKVGDFIVSVDGHKVGKFSDLNEVICNKKIGEEVKIIVWRRGEDEPLKFNVRLGSSKAKSEVPSNKKKG